MTPTVNLTLEQAYQLAFDAMTHNGFSIRQAEAVARNVTAGERDGYASHGLYRVLGCVRSLKVGKVVADAEPTLQDQAPAILRVDAHGAFSLVAYEKALPAFIEKVRQCGLAALAINHCVHYSALWADIEPLTEAGLVALACTPNHAWVAPAGGTLPLFGTNPIAFGWPRPNDPPFIFDMATTAAARGEIELHRRAGTPIPESWGIDKDGNPSTDPEQVLQGAMLTFGGYKGSALAAMVELLAGPLIGDMTSRESMDFDDGCGASPYGGELIIAMDPERFLGAGKDTHFASAEALFGSMKVQGARIPGERRYAARRVSEKDGVNLPKALYDDIVALCR